MRFFSTSALLVLGLAATPAYGRIRVDRRLQDPAPATPAAPAAAPASPATEQKELPACKNNFPPSKFEKTANGPFSFEAHKEAPFYKRTLAELAPCLLVEGDCGGSVHKVDVLTGALATVTQQVFDTTKAAEAAATTPAAPAADGQKDDAAPAVPVGEAVPVPPAPVALNTTTAAHPDGQNATTAAHPDGHNATTDAKPADHPTVEHNTTAVHPDAHNATTAAHPDALNATTAAQPQVHNATTAAHPPAHNATANATTTVGGVDLAKFTEALTKSEVMKTVLNEHAGCVAQQPGGADAFIKDYAKAVHDFISA